MRSSTVNLVVLEGDGIGPEIAAATLRVLDRATAHCGIALSFDHRDIGWAALETRGTTFPKGVLDAARAADGTVLGPVSHNDYPPTAEGGLNPSGELRKTLDLYANIRPAKTVAGLPSRCGRDADMVIVRENTEGFYADRNMVAGGGEFMPTEDVGLALRKITRQGAMRIAEMAFELAMTRERRQVTVVHKANVMRLTDGLFLECSRAVAARFPEVAYEEKIVDAVAALLVRDASAFDVILTTNMFGDILSDEATEIAGSLGLAASLNAGAEHAVAQAQHGSAPDMAGQDKANPASMIGSSAMLLDWLGERRGSEALVAAARLIRSALETTLADPASRTPDVGGELGTVAFTDAVLARLDARARV